MDSYNFHFERMSNVDLHPLSLPVSRLSPAKSNSSIADHLVHHQHGKGDSAYSSFSGGSTAPDYPSPFLPDDIQSSSFSHYADLKYVKSIYHPTQVLQSDSKTMDQLYRSVEAISQQYRNNTNTNVNHQNGNNSLHINNKALSKKEVPMGAHSHPTVRPPPVPARMDSFIATKNLENSRVHNQGTEFKPQPPQQQPRPFSRLHPQPHGQNAPKPETANQDTGKASFSSDPVFSVWRGSQQELPQAQQPPTYRPHPQPHDQTRAPLNPEYLSITDNKAAEQDKSINSISQPEHLKPRLPSSSGVFNEDHNNKPSGNSGHLESKRKRAHSAHDWLGSEPARAASPWNAGQGFINSSIQHKGQFYFVTGLCKLSESGMRTHSASVCGSETGSESSTVVLREKGRCHSTMDNLFRSLQDETSFSDAREALTSQSQDLSSRSQDQENHRLSLISMRSSRSFDTLEEIDMIQSRDISRHTANNPIFYCGPERNCPPHSTKPTKEVTPLISNEQPNPHKREEQAKRGKRQPLGDVASERINKETTPLLYHLTGASRAASQPKKDADFSTKGNEAILNKTGHGDVVGSEKERLLKSDTSKNDREEVACNTLDDSFKKYYKEKLKDAQSKVLRETSFKRRDLQLSWPHRTRPKPELRPTVIHAFSSSQDSETSTDTLTPSVASEETERESIKDEVRESQEERDKEAEEVNGRPANVAQPQVARIRGRKRLTQEQKKMCYSEPEKLNQLGGAPVHSACRSFGNDTESLFAVECEEEEPAQQGEQGLVAARRKMFETRGRALSASSATKSNLKHMQHKALVEYMVRKTGQKVPEPQQPAPQLPSPPRQRHSLGEKPFDWGPRPLSGNNEGKNTKNKPNRPHSAGRILDSSASSIRYAQFFSAQSCSGQYVGQSNQPRWRESQGPSQGKSASVESLLDQPEPPCFLRNRSTSTPQALDHEEDPLPVNAMETPSPQMHASEDSSLKPAPEGQQRVRVVAQRGKSMEELGASKLPRPSAMSKSSEQLDQLWRDPTEPGGPVKDKRSVSFFAEVRETQGLVRGGMKHNVTGQKETAIVGQGQTQNQAHIKSVSRQSSETEESASASRSSSPASCRTPSGSPGSHGPVTDEVRSSRPPSETPPDPPSPRCPETSEREIKSTSSTPTQTKLPCENRPSSRVKTSPSASGSEREQSVDEESNISLQLESNQEVSLSCGVTTDPSLWILPAEEEIKEEVQSSALTDNVFDDESTSPAPPTQTSETSVSACTSISDTDISQQVEEEEHPEPEDEKSGENQATEERGTQEGETESLERPAERPKWEGLVEAAVKVDQSLARVFYPLTNRKTALMLMEQLLSEDTLLMEEHYKKKQEQKGVAESPDTVEQAEPSPAPSAPDSPKPPSTDLQSKADITERKRLLASIIDERLHSLEETRGVLQAEIQENVAHGGVLEVLVRERCVPVELERYNLFIGDLERVVSLLLCLSARLARVQNALSTVDQHTDAEEMQSLDSRHRLLCKQREDAKDLKDNLDRRENLVSTFLGRQLSAEQLQDYRRFVQTKASLLIRQKDLEEKQRLGEEQLEALSNSL
ncbi:protein Shroom3 [Gymnodraco acuticeps]|uniref:Protein Shroom3 n=1 Tax=Gymnodraco acuticeps TaxID=8218 RepID=A0A6P8TF43_GYMAC|nr:protein Shroom3 [Gymnodraco acuticeps]XP_034062541.1 protein Shroom3 [Gymnodraco acuticeps]XP_034062542.1 protein Shroom3 [Gymnodraco acuticeps]XP_034062544.1 protein Shroom3 [Gymnodraco acuticeps]XP_034062545.1 protein Shroom3 [Gymnodraco acuticeps]XP_034062546.1 protein Shroom3 [Gymnodraco acuticeps]